MSSSPPLHVIIFSFNRGEYLAHCVTSIEQCAPWVRLSIFDDDSDDPSTRAMLDDCAQRHRMLTPSHGAAEGGGKHGGLYANMQEAFARLDDDEVFCFLQDDMQFVRRVDPSEVSGFCEIISGPHGVRVASPSFMKGCNRRSDAPLVRFDDSLNAYLVDRFERSAGAFYSDVCMGHAGAMRAAGWSFIPREPANERQARKILQQMAYLRNPFAAWLPNARAYRGKARTFALRIAEERRGCGFHPLAVMSENAREALMTRDAVQRPYAEDFLRPVGAAVPEPWIYHPLQGVRSLKWLNAAEIRLRRVARRAPWSARS